MKTSIFDNDGLLVVVVLVILVCLFWFMSAIRRWKRQKQLINFAVDDLGQVVDGFRKHVADNQGRLPASVVMLETMDGYNTRVIFARDGAEHEQLLSGAHFLGLSYCLCVPSKPDSWMITVTALDERRTVLYGSSQGVTRKEPSF